MLLVWRYKCEEVETGGVKTEIKADLSISTLTLVITIIIHH